MKRRRPVTWKVFTALVKVWGDDPPERVAGLIFSDRKPRDMLYAQYGKQITITELRKWPQGTSLQAALKASCTQTERRSR